MAIETANFSGFIHAGAPVMTWGSTASPSNATAATTSIMNTSAKSGGLRRQTPAISSCRGESGSEADIVDMEHSCWRQKDRASQTVPKRQYFLTLVRL